MISKEKQTLVYNSTVMSGILKRVFWIMHMDREPSTINIKQSEVVNNTSLESVIGMIMASISGGCSLGNMVSNDFPVLQHRRYRLVSRSPWSRVNEKSTVSLYETLFNCHLDGCQSGNLSAELIFVLSIPSAPVVQQPR